MTETSDMSGESERSDISRLPGQPVRLVMLGYFGFGNTGDEAVLAAELAALRRAFSDHPVHLDLTGHADHADGVEFTVVSGDPDHTMRVHGVPAVRRTDAGAVLKAIRSSDGLVAGGGSLLQDVTSARPVAFYAGLMLAARALGKPVFAYAQGLGPIRRRANRWLAAAALRSASYVSLRDPGSVDLARSLRVRDIEPVPDPVLGLEIDPPRPAGSRPALAVALRPWPGREDWLPPVVAALVKVSTDAELVFVPFHAGQDVDLARTVAAEVVAAGDATGRSGSVIRVVEPDGGYRAAIDAVAGCRAVFGMRLHALIAAAAARRPFVALSYDPKVTAFADAVGQPVAAELPAAVDSDALATALRAALSADSPALEREVDAARRPAVTVAVHYRRVRPKL